MSVYLDVEGDEYNEEKPAGLGRVEKIIEDNVKNVTVAVAFLVRRYWGPVVLPWGSLVRIPAKPDRYFPLNGFKCSLETMRRWLEEDDGNHTIFFKGTGEGIINPSRMAEESEKVMELKLHVQILTDALNTREEDFMRLLKAKQEEIDGYINPEVNRLDRLAHVFPEGQGGSASKRSIKRMEKELKEIKASGDDQGIEDGDVVEGEESDMGIIGRTRKKFSF